MKNAKRILSLFLVLMLLVSCASFFAEEEAPAAEPVSEELKMISDVVEIYTDETLLTEEGLLHGEEVTCEAGAEELPAEDIPEDVLAEAAPDEAVPGDAPAEETVAEAIPAEVSTESTEETEEVSIPEYTEETFVEEDALQDIMTEETPAAEGDSGDKSEEEEPAEEPKYEQWYCTVVFLDAEYNEFAKYNVEKFSGLQIPEATPTWPCYVFDHWYILDGNEKVTVDRTVYTGEEDILAVYPCFVAEEIIAEEPEVIEEVPAEDAPVEEAPTEEVYVAEEEISVEEVPAEAEVTETEDDISEEDETTEGPAAEEAEEASAEEPAEEPEESETPEFCTITFIDATGRTVASYTVDGTAGSAAVPAGPVYEGYDFEYWFIMEGGTPIAICDYVYADGTDAIRVYPYFRETEAEPVAEETEDSAEEVAAAEETDTEEVLTEEEPAAEDTEEATDGDAEASEEADGEEKTEGEAPAEATKQRAKKDHEVAYASVEDVLAPDRYIEVIATWDGGASLYFGDELELVAIFRHYDNVEFTMQWQHSYDNVNWEDIEGETGDTLKLILTEENINEYFRMWITMPDEVLVEVESSDDELTEEEFFSEEDPAEAPADETVPEELAEAEAVAPEADPAA